MRITQTGTQMKRQNPQTISTPWKDTIKLDNPLPEYPRPQLVRKDWWSLNGFWSFAVTHKDSQKPASFDMKIPVPFAPETALSGLELRITPDHRMWYQRTFHLPGDWPGKRVFLNFEAVDWQCTCLINGKRVGDHTGGYIPFSFDITDALDAGENELLLSVWDPTDSHWQQLGKQALNPDKIYYTATSGIWQTVWLEATRTENHISDLKLTPNSVSGTLELLIITPESDEFTAIVSTSENELCRINGLSNQPLTIPVSKPRIWSPQDPFLYDLTILLHRDNENIDRVESYFGMRSVSAQNTGSGFKRICLNGSPVFLHGPLDQGYWPESGMTPPCDEALLFDLQKTREMGFNMVRKHIKVESRRWYYHADRLGLVVIQDMVNSTKSIAGELETTLLVATGKPQRRDDNPKSYKKAGRSEPESREGFESELKEMMDHLHNSPSLMIWVPFNESWGQFDAKRICDLVRKKDHTRLIDHASGWYDQGCGDFVSRHRYVLKLKKPPAGDNRIYFISEYGGYSLVLESHLWQSDKSFKYKTYKDRESLENAFERLIRKQLLPLIEKGLGAAVYTQLADVEIECNGIFTYDRKVQKISTSLLNSLNRELYRQFDLLEKQQA